ncbi:lysophospholipid acyltransferase family protein [Bdellovibrio sp. HCB2-146]|uniref:lysophospholipid acyltransferase family protein n=1 Tax=Bdellovibrio sp. HCB2-146 TaxID=3394362 RepID=UPI0039BC4EC6
MIFKWLSYPRSLIATIIFPIYTVLCAIAVIFLSFTIRKRWLEDQVVYAWAKGVCWMFGVRVVVKGMENIPPGGCLFVFNHTSFFDIFAMSGWLGSFRFGAKIELFSIPFFGAAMRRAGILPIARNRRDEVYKVYSAAEARIKAGERFALSPEGTRQSEEILAPFKAGPFVFAINAKAPLVPVIVKGALAVMPKGRIVPNWGSWKRTITLEVLPPISTEGHVIDERTRLQEELRKAMEPYFSGDGF